MKGYLSIHNFKTGRYSISTEIKVQEYTQPITQKWLNGDILDMRGNEPAVISRNAKAHKSLVGIIDFVNHIRVGMTPKGVPLYNFHPYDTAYPVMQVASKHTSTENKIALAAFEHWDNKVPRAGIQHIFGCVGDTEAEIAALRMGIVVPRTITEEQIPEANTRIHDGSEWDIVFNIDPDGCKDVDDVMGWRKTPTKLEFFIGIVDIDSWIPEGSTLDIDAMKAGQTLYIDGVAVEPMFPEEISERRASLRADGVKRPVLALVYTFPNNAEIQVQEPSWALLNVHVHEA
jgi:exoribonuclease R